MSDYCDPPPYALPPGYKFDVHEKCVDSRIPPEDPDAPPPDPGDPPAPPANVFEADLGPLQDPVLGPIINFYNYADNTLAITKTLSLKGPKVPLRISWSHYSQEGIIDPATITSHSVKLTPDEPSYEWPEGMEIPGTPPTFSDYSLEYDFNFIAHRAV